MKLKNMLLHFKTITKHKWFVFKLSIRAGIPFLGLVHDLSKYSPTEFFENAKYMEGTTYSPITSTYKVQGYSKAWLHHKGRNKHHPEYWYDEFAPIKSPVIEYKYVVEMVCDKLAASLVYNGKYWKAEDELEYIKNSEDNKLLNKKTYDFLIEVFTQITKSSIKEVINKKSLKKMYNNICK